MKSAAKIKKKVKYSLGYSNYTFDLWIILHKSCVMGRKSHRLNYLSDINRCYNTQFESMAVASDTIPLSNVSDGVLYVVDAKSSDKRRVKTAINDLKRNGGHVIGVVLNKVDMSDENHYGYGYGYGYGGDDDGKKK